MFFMKERLEVFQQPDASFFAGVDFLKDFQRIGLSGSFDGGVAAFVAGEDPARLAPDSERLLQLLCDRDDLASYSLPFIGCDMQDRRAC